MRNNKIYRRWQLMKYYISDLHFGHHNVLKFDSRPFGSVEEMNQVLIDNWNNTIKPNDEVYLLGDIFWKNDYADEILPKLKGQKHLIKGNHDKINNTMQKHYESIQEYKRIKDEGRVVVLSHYPIAHWDAQFHGSYHLYGHIHVTQDRAFYEFYKDYCIEKGLQFNSFNVGCMMPQMNYTPRTLDYLIEFHKTKIIKEGE